MKIAIIGAGNMGGAVARGLAKEAWSRHRILRCPIPVGVSWRC